MTPACCSECVARSAVIAIGQALGASIYEKNNAMTSAYAQSALQFISENIKALKRPRNKNACLALANASVMASIAFSDEPGIAHLLADELAKTTDIAAGTLTRILLPHALAYLMHKKVSMPDQLLLALAGIDRYAATPAQERSRKGIEMTLQLLVATKKYMPESMKPLKVQQYKLAEIAKPLREKAGSASPLPIAWRC